MKSNPGGQIDTTCVVGRNELIASLWDILEVQSVRMTAERRIGKTSVLNKMRDEAPKGWRAVYQDLEKCHSALDFAMAVYKEVHQFLTGKNKAARWTRELFQVMGGVEIGGLFKMPEKGGPHWKDILTKTIEDLVHESADTDTRLLFLWDEVPFMLANIRDREGEQAAMEVLDVLRALRQTHPSLRMVITGSIGLHHVLVTLKQKNYGNAPVNDMALVEVLPLEAPYACQLARRLIEGEGLACADPATTAAAIAQEADCFPYYLHHIVRALRLRRLPATPQNAAAVVAAQLVDDNDPWELLHYDSRLHTYYGDHQDTVRLILDDLSATRAAATVNELLIMLKNTSLFDDRSRLLDLLSLLVRDHYLLRDAGTGAYSFRFPLIRRWWKTHRSL